MRVHACGVCHTDLHGARGDWPVKPTTPFVRGHEVAGVVVALGSQVENLAVGDRVGIAWLHEPAVAARTAAAAGRRSARSNTTRATP